MSTSTHHDWPTQLRLPGQAAAPEGPVDMQVMYLMHRGFRRDLDRFTLAAQRTPVDDRETWRLLGDRWATFAEILHNHHSGEDAGLWPWLLEHGTPADVATLEAMESEHAEIDPLLTSCADGFAQLADEADEDARAALAVRLVATRDSLGRHLEHEETDAITIIQRLMTQEEWRQLDEEFFKKELTPRLVFKIVPWAAYGISPQVRDRIFAETGLGFKLVWLVTRRRFAGREQRAFRYA
jgi:hemerythrin-like domain-containing protein